MNAGLSRGGLLQPGGQHLRREGSDQAWTGSSCRGEPGRADDPRSDSRLWGCLYYCGGGLCLDYVRACAGRIVHKRAVWPDGACVTQCIGHHSSMARVIVPIQSCSRPRGLHRRPDECHSGSCCCRAQSSLGVHERRLNDTVGWGVHCSSTEQPFRDPRSTVESRDRYRIAVVVSSATCRCRPPASWIVRVHSVAPIESMHHFPLVIGEISYSVTNNKFFARFVSRAGVCAVRRCIHSWTMGSSLYDENPLHFNLFRKQHKHSWMWWGKTLSHVLFLSVCSFACFSCLLGETKRKTTLVVYSVPALAIVLTKSQLDISSPCYYRLLRAYHSGCCDTRTTGVTLPTVRDDKPPLYSPLCVKKARLACQTTPPSSHSCELVRSEGLTEWHAPAHND